MESPLQKPKPPEDGHDQTDWTPFCWCDDGRPLTQMTELLRANGLTPQVMERGDICKTRFGTRHPRSRIYLPRDQISRARTLMDALERKAQPTVRELTKSVNFWLLQFLVITVSLAGIVWIVTRNITIACTVFVLVWVVGAQVAGIVKALRKKRGTKP